MAVHDDLLKRRGIAPCILYGEVVYEFFSEALCSNTIDGEKERHTELRVCLEKMKLLYPSRKLIALRATALAVEAEPRAIGSIYRRVDGEAHLFDLSEVEVHHIKKKEE